MCVEKSDSTQSILLTISLEINMCTVLKALREVTSFHLSASSLHHKRQAVFYYRAVYSLSVFTYFHICIGDGGRV